MTSHHVERRKKLIEVAIPLEVINTASAREKSIRHGHPSTLHLWWALRPLAAARAVIFCQMVDDPLAVPEKFPTEEAQEKKRLRLFALISELAQWENTTNEQVLNRAQEEIRRRWRRCFANNADHPEAAELFNPEKLPGFRDPFAGGGALPLEAQRLGLEAYASDLNPVAVLINKAMIEIPPKFAGKPPVIPECRRKQDISSWKGAQGLADDVRYYGKWMRDEAEKRIGHLYPKIKITPEMVAERPDLRPYENQELTVIDWLWARTVKSHNPAFSHVEVPLASSFMLSTKAGKEAYVEPVIEEDGYRFSVKVGKPQDGEATQLGARAIRDKLNAFLWRERPNVEVRELVDWCRKYLFLARISSDQMILNALINPQAAMSGESTFHLADDFQAGSPEGSPGRYSGLRHQSSSSTQPPSLNSLIVKDEVALAQIEADRARPEDPPAPRREAYEEAGTPKQTIWTSSGEKSDRPEPGIPQPPSPQPPKPQLPTRYMASVKLDPTRASLQMSAFVEEVMSHLQALPGAQIEMSLKIQVNTPDGNDEQTARIVIENSASLKVDQHGLY